MKLKEYKEPWKATFRGIKWRIQTGTYFRKNIKCLISAEELKILWFRDNACAMKEPSIDRKNNNGNYIFKNCQYIEFNKNRGKMDRKTLKKISRITSMRNKIMWQDLEFRRLVSSSTKNQWKNEIFRKAQSLRSKKRIKRLWRDSQFRKIRSQNSKLQAIKAKRDNFGRFKKKGK